MDLAEAIGLVPYHRDYASSYQQIWKVSQTPGADPTQVTSQTTTFDSDPDVSPDESQIAFLRQVSGSYRLHVMDADGSNVTQLDASNNARAPMWKPDGSQIVYRIGASVIVINPDGTGKTVLYTAGGSDVVAHPTYNRDGSFIAFHIDKSSALTVDELWVMDDTGGSPTKLSDASRGGLGGLAISWAHGSDTIAFIERISSNNHVSIINANGTGKTQLTNTTIAPSMAKYAWAADDSAIFVARTSASPWAIYNVSPSGGQAALSPTLNGSTVVGEGIPVVYGDRIYVVRDTTWDLVSVAADGSGLRVEDDINPGDFSVFVELTGNGTEL